MKKLMLICGVSLAFTFAACNKNNGKNSTDLIETPASANNPDAKGPTAKIVFTETEFDFGKVTEGETVEHVFIFKNEGDADLVIKGATSSCGCTVPDPPKHPIKPGKEEKIRVTFNSQGKKDLVEKEITVVTNAVPAVSQLKIKCFVISNNN